ncbi:MAG: helix-turn-helix domain-containing protein [Peptococcaceae bacterium]|nr:helix-turn-helix domain-containing protein [Peptococcaceae bacterium]
MDFGHRMRELRKLHNITVNGMAELMGVSTPTITRWENGTVDLSASVIKKFCSLIGITLAEFFTVEGQDLAQLPKDLWELVSAPDNYDLLRQIIAMKKEGYSNEVIAEWLSSLNKALKDIKKHGVYVVGEYLPGDKKFTEQEEQEIAEKLSEKLNDPNFTPPWEKMSNND